jgi:ubiquinone biosynthesis protein
LGRQLDPDLDLWKTAKPYLERWMDEQVGWRGLIEKVKAEAPRYNKIVPQLPRLIHQALTHRHEHPPQEQIDAIRQLVEEQKRTNLLLSVAVYLGGGLVFGLVLFKLLSHWHLINL